MWLILVVVWAEVVPQQDLADLTADDLQLLLSGTGGAITLERCRKVAEFRDMRGPEVKASDPERLGAFSRLVWDALALMQPRELLKLVEFATAHRTIVKTLIVNLVSALVICSQTNTLGHSHECQFTTALCFTVFVSQTHHWLVRLFRSDSDVADML